MFFIHIQAILKSKNYYPAGTWRKYNVASTSMQRHDVTSTLRRRYIYVMCLPGSMHFCGHLTFIQCRISVNLALTPMQRHAGQIMFVHRRINIDATSWCCNDINAELSQRHNVASLLMRRCINAMCPLVSLFILTLVLLNQDIPCHCKQCRSRSIGF